MEVENNKIIPLDNGLCTIIPGILSKTGYTGWTDFTRTIYETSEKKESLITLIYHADKLTLGKGANDYEIFCPLTIKESNGFIENLGQFDKKKHREAVEAIRIGKALYYAQGQGALVYSMDKQPNQMVCKNLNDILDNAKKNEVKLPKHLGII
jgi:hypothetical protein